jgi:hypothetical protein
VKAILVMDMPSSCDMCRLASLVDKGEVMCAIDRMETRKYEDACKDKPNWCPLKSVPEKKDENKIYTMTQLYRAQGYNACIDEILGDKD